MQHYRQGSSSKPVGWMASSTTAGSVKPAHPQAKTGGDKYSAFHCCHTYIPVFCASYCIIDHSKQCFCCYLPFVPVRIQTLTVRSASYLFNYAIVSRVARMNRRWCAFAAVRAEEERRRVWGHPTRADGGGNRLHGLHTSVSVLYAQQATPVAVYVARLFCVYLVCCFVSVSTTVP